MKLVEFEIINKKMRIKVKNKDEFLTFVEKLNFDINGLQKNTGLTSLMELLILSNISKIEEIRKFESNNSDDVISSLNEKNIVLESKFSALEIVYQNELDQLKLENKTLKDTDYIKKLNEKDNLIISLENDINSLKEKLNAEKDIVNNQLSDLNNSYQKIDNLKKDIENFEIDAENYNKSIFDLKEELALEKTKLNDVAQNNIQSFEEEKNKLLETIKNLEEEISNLNKEKEAIEVKTNIDEEIDELFAGLDDDYDFLDDIDTINSNNNSNDVNGNLENNTQNIIGDDELEIVYLRLEYVKKQIKSFVQQYN